MAIGRGGLFPVHLYQAMILQPSMTNPEDRALPLCTSFVRILGVQPPLECGDPYAGYTKDIRRVSCLKYKTPLVFPNWGHKAEPKNEPQWHTSRALESLSTSSSQTSGRGPADAICREQ